jgi:hypothetical protein
MKRTWVLSAIVVCGLAVAVGAAQRDAGAGQGAGRGGGGRGGGGGGIGPGVYRVVLSVDGKEAGAQTFSILDDIWLNEK